MVVLGVVEVGSRHDLGGDLPVPLAREPALVLAAGCLGGGSLLLTVGVDPRAVLRTDVVALAHALGRIVALPEDLEKGLVGDPRGIVDHPHHLVVAGGAATDLAIRRVGGFPGGISHRGRDHPFGLPELLLRAPETAEAEQGETAALGKRGLETAAEHLVPFGDRHRLGAARQGLARGRQRLFVEKKAHGQLLRPRTPSRLGE